MVDRSAIEWTDATWNPIRGTVGRWTCVKVSPGCEYCYAQRLNTRFGGPEYKVGADAARLDEKALTQPLRWKEPRKIFVCSMSDLFGDWVSDEWLARILNVMVAARQHTFQVLTKRPERMHQVLTTLAENSDALHVPFWPLPNVWLGVTAESQQYADERIPLLLQTPAAIRFVSAEPLLGPLELRSYLQPTIMVSRPRVAGGVKGPTDVATTRQFDQAITEVGKALAKQYGQPYIDWVITGGESGGPWGRRLINNEAAGIWWVRSIRDQCQAAGVSFLFKQWGGPTPKSGGRLLDGRTWDDYPDTHATD